MKRKKKTKVLKITKEQIIKLRRKVNRELTGTQSSGTGYHISDRDRPRKRIKPHDVKED